MQNFDWLETRPPRR